MLNRIFTPFPILVTERLTLRQLTATDEQEILVLRSDTEINKYLDREPARTIDDARNFINSINDKIKKNEAIYWVITLTDSKAFAGTICLFGFSDTSNSCEIGYELLRDFQGQGIMQEAAKNVIEYAFQVIKVQTIEAFTHQDNKGSTKLLETFNFKKSAEPEKENPDCYTFSLSNPNY